MASIGTIAVWAIAAFAILGILLRPWRLPEWVWAGGAAVLLVVTRLLDWHGALAAIARGLSVYAFLTGIMMLAEIARHERVFDWVADMMLRAARGSRRRLLGLVFGTGTLVTALLSNDTTVVVLTPAVFAALSRTDADPLPFLYACAFVANAASFVLPFSNPANLVIFGHALPSLQAWFGAFALPAAGGLVVTYLALRLASGRAVRGVYTMAPATVKVDARVRLAAFAVGFGAAGLVVAALFHLNLGGAAIIAAVLALVLTALTDRTAPRAVVAHVAWGVIPMVAGLFVIVQALSAAGTTGAVRHLFAMASHLGAAPGNLLIGAVVTIADCLFNNLPVALASGYALQSTAVPQHLTNATLIAVDLGPNLAVTGSLATLLWLIALRRAGIEVTAWHFLRLGAVVVTPALIAAMLLVR